MDNPVVVRAAEVAQALGVATLRFNFRSVGASGGTHDHGTGEQEDCRAALGALRARLGGASPVGLLGYSFGAWVAARVASAGAALSGLCLVAPPVAMYGFDGLALGRGELLLVAGSRDPYCPADELRRLTERLGTEARIIEGAEHFFFGKLFPLGEAVEAWIRRWTAAGP
jgi:uncharacterized protein